MTTMEGGKRLEGVAEQPKITEQPNKDIKLVNAQEVVSKSFEMILNPEQLEVFNAIKDLEEKKKVFEAIFESAKKTPMAIFDKSDILLKANNSYLKMVLIEVKYIYKKRDSEEIKELAEKSSIISSILTLNEEEVDNLNEKDIEKEIIGQHSDIISGELVFKEDDWSIMKEYVSKGRYDSVNEWTTRSGKTFEWENNEGLRIGLNKTRFKKFGIKTKVKPKTLMQRTHRDLEKKISYSENGEDLMDLLSNSIVSGKHLDSLFSTTQLMLVVYNKETKKLEFANDVYLNIVKESLVRLSEDEEEVERIKSIVNNLEDGVEKDILIYILNNIDDVEGTSIETINTILTGLSRESIANLIYTEHEIEKISEEVELADKNGEYNTSKGFSTRDKHIIEWQQNQKTSDKYEVRIGIDYTEFYKK